MLSTNLLLVSDQQVIELWDRDIKRLIYSVRTPPYNPLDDYLDQLPAWDGYNVRKSTGDNLNLQ